MLSGLRWVGVLGVGLLTFGVPAGHAQFGYLYPGGYGGWSGWGGTGTVAGNNAMGMGFFAAGAGQYNLQTARAEAINLDTAIRFNQALWATQRERNYNYYVRQVQGRQNLNEARDSIYRRIRDNPSADDIASGNALNVALDQVTDPKVYAAGLSQAQVPIPSALIKDIPFNKASEAITVSLNDLIDPRNWPKVLDRPVLSDERDALAVIAARARAEDDEGEIAPETLQQLQAAVTALRQRVVEVYPEDSRERRLALPYLRALGALTRMLHYPEVRELLAHVEEQPNRTLADLISFMRSFNLRFGVADTPRERAVYQEIYPLLDRLRDAVAAAEDAAVATTESPQRDVSRFTDFFGAMPDESLEPRPIPSVPTFRPTDAGPKPPADPNTPPSRPRPADDANTPPPVPQP